MDIASAKKLHENGSGLRLFQGIRPVSRAGAMRDALAGFTLAAMNVPQALGYTKIAGMPVVTGLYTLLLPLVAFATFGSSRYLVVAADSATAAILAGALSHMAPVASAHYVALAGLVALLTAGCLLLARLFKLGFLADFLSQTVLVGFLTGVGFQVGIAVLGEMLGVPVESRRTVEQLAPGGPGLAAGACADDLSSLRRSWRWSSLAAGSHRGYPARCSPSWAQWQPVPRLISPRMESPSSGRWQEACRGSEYQMWAGARLWRFSPWRARAF